MNLTDDLELLLIRHQAEIATNTPLCVLAKHMVASLDLFEASLVARSNHDFFHPERRRAETRDPFADPVPHFVFTEDEPVSRTPCGHCED